MLARVRISFLRQLGSGSLGNGRIAASEVSPSLSPGDGTDRGIEESVRRLLAANFVHVDGAVSLLQRKFAFLHQSPHFLHGLQADRFRSEES